MTESPLTRDRRSLSVGQSADPDDAFMAWGLARGGVGVAGHDIECVFDDIQTLNEAALHGRLDLTALSAGAYPAVAAEYRLLRAGASFGADYGPLVVGREPAAAPGPATIAGMRVAVPGLLTTAYLLLRTHAGDIFEPVPMRFDAIIAAVLGGEVDAGLIIHEGQLTYREHGLHALCEPARAWHRDSGLPVPLGVVAVRRSLGNELSAALARAFTASIEAARAHPEEALAFAAEHGRGLDAGVLRQFVDQYVDEITTDMGDRGIAALEKLYRDAAGAGLIEGVPALDLL
ncbi:MAG: ABC transporter substrate-binding protein [Acidobacteriota bacterium]